MAGSDDDSRSGGALDAAERRELERLRSEVASLRAGTPSAGEARPRSHVPRWTAATALLVLMGLLLVTSVAARYIHSEILDTDRYVATVAPLGADQAVQQAVTDRITDEIVDRVDIERLTANALTELAESAPRLEPVVGLAPVIAGQARNFVHDTVGAVVASDEFEDLWVQANRAAHAGVVALVTGETGSSAVRVDDSGTVGIHLGVIIDKVQVRLSERGFAFADEIPQFDEEFVLIESPELAEAQRVVRILDSAATVLPWLTLLAAAAAVWMAPRGSRLRALVCVGATFIVAMAVMAVALNAGRAVYLDNLPPGIRSPAAAAAILDAVAAPLRNALRAVVVVGLVLAVGAYLMGGSASASAIRRGLGRVPELLRRRGSARPPTSTEIWFARAVVPLRLGVVGAAVLLLVFWDYPTATVVGWVVVVALAALLLLEVVARPTVARVRPVEAE
ncbi:hypothetical protein [Nocardia sp. NPDC019395]|uniref:hypothetical protein n=1 Tax=Nocardia sp. NPDC019395 TaxID=3154686 RepID=UPI0033DED351